MMTDGELVEVTAAETAGSEELLTNSAGAVAKRGACRASVSFTIISIFISPSRQHKHYNKKTQHTKQ